ncbi:MAG: efflux RND transporter periplasmic adaptor subunit [Candidatus Acidiferrales bacterium]
MRFGPTSLQVSSVLAKGLRRPKLRSEIRISEQTVAGETSYVIKVHETNSYNRYGATEYELLTLCDGTRTAAEIAQEMTGLHPDSPLNEPEVLEFIESVDAAMWDRPLGEKNLAVLERIRDERKSRVDQSSVLYISFKAWDPDKTLARLDPYLGWMFTRGFVVFSIFIFLVAAYLLAGDWSRVQQDTSSLYTFAGKSAYDIWAFWLILLGLGAIHEFGHGLTCKHYGGDVHQMGFLLIYFTPAFFTDTTDILLFQSGAPRQWVIFAGIWIELVVCGISAVIWHFTLPGTLFNDLAYKTMLLSGIQGAFLNLNPLIKADGYYALSQFLDIDNLREEAFEYLRAWTRKYFLRQDVELPVATRRQRRIFLIFGIAAVIYSVSLIGIVLLFVNNVLVSKFDDWGYLLTAAIVYFFARKGLRQAWPRVQAWARSQREAYMKWKMTRPQQAGALAVVLLLLIPPFPSRVSTDLVLEPGREAAVRAQVGGQVTQVMVRDGDAVKAGDLLAVLANPDVRSAAETLGDELAQANSSVRRDESRLDLAAAAGAARDRTKLENQSAVAAQQLDALQLRAPFDGIVETPGVAQEQGKSLAAGEEFCRIVDRNSMRARILVPDWELQDVKDGARVQVKVVSYPYRTYSGQVDQIMPAASPDVPVAQTEQLQKMGQKLTNYFAVIVDFPNPDGSLREGMTGTARIKTKSYPLGWQAGRAAWRWIGSQFW